MTAPRPDALACATAVLLALKGARLYPEGHPERTRRDRALIDRLSALAEGEIFEIDFNGKSTRLGDAAGTLLPSPLFDDLLRAARECGLRRYAVADDHDAAQARELIETLLGHRQPPTPEMGVPAATALPTPGTATRTQPVAIQRPVAVLPEHAPCENDLVGALDGVWSGIVARRRADRAALEQIVVGLSRLPGDGAVEPLMLLTGRSPRESLLAHALNCGHVMLACARAAGLGSAETRRVAESAVLADIGMLSVPESLLASPERLQRQEFAEVRAHVVAGARLLLGTLGLPCLPGVLAYEHHMRAGGKGYPTPERPWTCAPESLLLQVADSYVAMRSERPFRGAIPDDEARSLLERLAGGWLDPHAVELVLQRALPAGTRAVDRARVLV